MGARVGLVLGAGVGEVVGAVVGGFVGSGVGSEDGSVERLGCDDSDGILDGRSVLEDGIDETEGLIVILGDSDG